MEGLVLILGEANDDGGNLSEISISRLEKGIEACKSNPGYKILCTGGFGEHFNRTDLPQAAYAVRYLQEHGIPLEDIVEIAESRDTKEDATKARKIVDNYKITNLIVVSSDYHMGRVRRIFEHVFAGYKIQFLESKTAVPKKERDKLIAHEKSAMKRLDQENWPQLAYLHSP
jgi:uncharacterized SAM-binding protein YcdF (DUF218 family)